MYKNTPVIIVSAMSRRARVIGKANDLLWKIPEDMKRFRELTLDHPLIMGRKTFESILTIAGKPLPNRPNIVVTRNPNYQYEGVEVVDSLEAGFETALRHQPTEIHIGGGSEIYKQALPFVDELKLTFVDDEPEGDSWFPEFADEFVLKKSHGTKVHEGISYEWVDFVRK
jgi:dihydrofolate reductase